MLEQQLSEEATHSLFPPLPSAQPHPPTLRAHLLPDPPSTLLAVFPPPHLPCLLQAAEYWQMAFLSMLSMVQASVAWIGLASGLVVCVWGVAEGSLTVGDTVLFVTMMQQLYVPLTYFGSYYRQVSMYWKLLEHVAPACGA